MRDISWTRRLVTGLGILIAVVAPDGRYAGKTVLPITDAVG